MGYPKLNSPFWLGVVAPAGTPPEIVNKLNAAFRESLNDPATRERLDALGAEIKIDTPETFGRMIASQLALWNSVVRGRRHQGRVGRRRAQFPPLSSPSSPMRSTDTTFSSSAVLNTITPCVERPAMRMPFTGQRISCPPSVTSMS